MFDDTSVHPPAVRARARQQYLTGSTAAEIAKRFVHPCPTVRHWCTDRPEPKRCGAELGCFRYRECVDNPTDLATYAHLLGLYFGGGHLVTFARASVLRIYCSDT